MNELIKVSNLNFSYGDNLILSNANLELNASDFAVLIGSNGSGKSTLFKIITGQLKSNTGDVEILGKKVSEFNDWEKIGYIPQIASALFDGFPATVEEVVLSNLYKKIGFFRFPKKNHKAIAHAALEKMGVLEFKNRPISELSGGQKQKVLIARALVNDPQILLLDEPTIGIDFNSLNQFYKILSDLNKEGMTIFMITHSMQEMTEYINKAYCIEYNDVLPLSIEQIKYELKHKHKHQHNSEEI